VTFVIEQTIEVTATPAVVWEVIVDLPRYGEWNPFVVECRSTLAVGDPIDMRVHVFAAAHMPGDNSRSVEVSITIRARGRVPRTASKRSGSVRMRRSMTSPLSART
jgi:hypothetical protein